MAGEPAVAAGLESLLRVLNEFRGQLPLRERVSQLEVRFTGVAGRDVRELLGNERVQDAVLGAGLKIKSLVGQINVTIHAIGILLSLPHVLEPDERIEVLSLGAGTVAEHRFDLETDRRIAEFKFITWQGRDAVRQDGLFADLAELVITPTTKNKYLYVAGIARPMAFLRGGRALASVCARRPKLLAAIQQTDPHAKTVRDYFHAHEQQLIIRDVREFLPSYASQALAVETDEAGGDA